MIENGIPTIWQNVIFRNYGLVPIQNIAKVLECDAETVEENAKLLGLGQVEYCDRWLKQGFVTIIRNNWDLLPNDKIIELLDITQEKFNYYLKDYDFLDVKLGAKIDCEFKPYSPLTDEQLIITQAIREKTEKNYKQPKVLPFDFFADYSMPVKTLADGEEAKEIYTSCYCGDYGDTLLDDNLGGFTDEYLEKVSASGVNGLWIHDTLRNLADFPFDPSLSKEHVQRTANLRKLTERCKKHGVNIYVYLNEPRTLDGKFFDKYPHLRGQKCGDDEYCLCMSVPEVREYFYNAIQSIARDVPLLKGIMTITMSENNTHCYSRLWAGEEKGKTSCPHCKDRSAVELATDVNNIIAKALRDMGSKTKVIANIWAWSKDFMWTDDMVLKGIDLLDKDVEVLCVSEYSKAFSRGGVDTSVIDYSISVVGPSDITIKALSHAKAKGHKIWAKMQLNNSWECAAVPYVPAYNLMLEHISNVKKLGVSGFMVGWSLGGYPGGALPLCCLACNKDDYDKDKWFRDTYGEHSKVISNAVDLFSEAFAEYPFHVSTIYYGNQHLSCGNIWNIKPTGKHSSMVCFCCDDEWWLGPYPLDTYINQFKLLTTKWEKALKLIDGLSGNVNVEEFKRVCLGGYILLKSTLNWAEYVKYKKNLSENKAKLLELIESERELTKKLILLMGQDAKIGYEISNHYFFNNNLLLEKLLNLDYLQDYIVKE